MQTPAYQILLARLATWSERYLEKRWCLTARSSRASLRHCKEVIIQSGVWLHVKLEQSHQGNLSGILGLIKYSQALNVLPMLTQRFQTLQSELLGVPSHDDDRQIY